MVVCGMAPGIGRAGHERGAALLVAVGSVLHFCPASLQRRVRRCVQRALARRGTQLARDTTKRP